MPLITISTHTLSDNNTNNITIAQAIATELNLALPGVQAVINLLEEGATLPFIARYRKEATGGLDEVAIAAIRDRSIQLQELDKRRTAISKSILEQGKLTDRLQQQIDAAATMSALEDLYLPYKPKRRTRATIAREKGLEPLADIIFEQQNMDPTKEAAIFVNAEKGVEDTAQAIAGAKDILAEKINEDATAREKIRLLFEKEANCTTKVINGKEAEGQKYKDYFEWSEPIGQMPSHRLLAVRRAEKEGILMLNITPEEEAALNLLEEQFVTAQNAAGILVAEAVKDAYKRLMRPSIETEIRLSTKKKADLEAVRIFAENLRQLLLASPLGQKRVLALDPGFRSGCKLVCLNEEGKLLHETVIYPHEPQRQATKSAQTVLACCQKYNIEAIAIGNGTASRETETFVKSISDLPKSITVVMVSENGASVYSASDVARREFPDHDLTVRGAVSIGRRLMDPLAELVKIDPKSIGVGQYQHDVEQNLLKTTLDDVTMSCVNRVGVELNTASRELLSYVSGLGSSLAENIVNHRNDNGPFSSRKELMAVPRLGAKAFEQAAGFLRIREAAHPLDSSAVHPERYALVEQMAADAGCTIKDLMQDKSERQKIDLKKYVNENVGLPTLTDIMNELARPGRDPREQFEAFAFADGIHNITDLREGMKLPGIITNITAFGAFVDVGVHQDGLVHISQMADRFIKDPAEVVKLQQHVQVTVTEIDVARKRIALSMKSEAAATPKPADKSKTGVTKPKAGQGSKKPRLTKPPQQKEESLQDKLAALKHKFR